MFEKASRTKLRFNTTRGQVGIEDLWDMPLESNDGFSLDELAKNLNIQLKDTEESFVRPKKKTGDSPSKLAFDIVKHVIQVKLDDIEAKKNAAARKAQKEKILNVISEKQDDALKGKSIASLKKLLDEL